METCDDNFFWNLIFDPWWNLHDVLNERKVVDYFFQNGGRICFVLFFEGKKKGVRRILWTT
jgi:hypothetical protein